MTPGYDQPSTMSSGYQPMGSGGVMPANRFEGLPFGDSSAVQLAAPFVTPWLQSHMAVHGYQPYGNTQQNFMDRQRSFKMTGMHRTLMQETAAQNTQQYMKTARNVYERMNGANSWNPEQEQQVHDMIGGVTSMLAPLGATGAPEIMNAAAGGRDPTLMMHGMLQGAATRLDPATGMQGMSIDSIKNQHAHLMKEYYGDDANGKPKDISAKDGAMGFNSREMGEIYGSMARRGMIAGTVRGTQSYANTMQTMDPDMLHRVMKRTFGDEKTESFKTDGKLDMGKIGRMSQEDIKKVSGDSEMDTAIRTFDSKKTKVSIDKYKGAIRAMSDVFGDTGRKGDIDDLINMIEAFTNGATGKLDPGRIEMLVRNSHQLAKSAGLSTEEMLNMQSGFTARAEKMGMDPIFGTLATQHAMAGRAAFDDLGMGSVSAWGRLNKDQFTQATGNAMLQAQNSQHGNTRATADYIRSAVGDKAIPAGSELEAYMTANKAGQTHYTYKGETKPMTSVTTAGLGQMAERDTGGMINAAQVAMIGADRKNMEGHSAATGVADAAYYAQGEQLRKKQSLSVAAGLRVSGFTDPKEVERLSETITQGFGAMSQASFADSDTRNQLTSEALLKDDAVKRMLIEKGGMEKDKNGDMVINQHGRGMLTTMATVAYSNAERALGTSGYTNQSMHQMYNPQTAEQVRRRTSEAKVRALASHEFAGLAVGSGAQKAMDAIINKKSFEEAGLTLAGGVDQDKMRAALKERVDDFNARRQDLQTHIDKTMEPLNQKEREASAKTAALDKEYAEKIKGPGMEEGTDARKKYEAEVAKKREGIQAEHTTIREARQKEEGNTRSMKDALEASTVQLHGEMDNWGVSREGPSQAAAMEEAARSGTEKGAEAGVKAGLGGTVPAKSPSVAAAKTAAGAATAAAKAEAAPASDKPTDIVFSGNVKISRDGTTAEVSGTGPSVGITSTNAMNSTELA